MVETTRNVSPTMAKLDFSSLKTADLRSVAPVDENAIPRAQQAPESDVPVSVSLPQVSAAPVSTIEAPVHVPASSLPHVPAAPVVRTPPVTVHASKKISLTSLRGGGPSAVSHAPAVPATSAPVASVSEPIAARTPTVAVSTVSKRSATTISLGTKPAVQAPVPSQETPVVAQIPATDAVGTASEPAVEPSDEDGRALIEGVDIIQAAKVIGTEGETLANEILTESLKDPEAVKKEAEEKAVAAVVIPETEKVFFPNLEMDDDFFDDPLFEGIVPAKPDKKPEVRQPLEMKKEEPVAQAVAVESAPVETAEADSGVSVAKPTEALMNEPERAVAEAVEAEVKEASAVSEIAVQETAAVEATDPATSAEVESVLESPSQIPAEAYVETVAKEISAERKGGLSKLFGERKVLVRAMAGFFAVAVLGVGAFQFVSPSIKTSGPEAMNTGSELPKYVPTGETKIIGEGVRVHTGRRPNVHKNKKALPVTNSGTVASSWAVSDSGTVALPVSESGSDAGSGSTASGAEILGPVQVGSGSLEVSAGAAAPEKISWESPVPTDMPTNTGAVETSRPNEGPAPSVESPSEPTSN